MDFDQKINQISKGQWQSLFDLIPTIEKTSSFGVFNFGDENEGGEVHMPTMESEKIVSDFVHKIEHLDLMIVFDWGSWKEGENLLNNTNTNYNELSTETLCKLITAIIRADRFTEGYLVSCFKNGVILKILYGLKRNMFG